MPHTAESAEQKFESAVFMHYTNKLLHTILNFSTFTYAMIYPSSASGIKEVSSCFLEGPKTFTSLRTSEQLLSLIIEHQRSVQKGGIGL